MEQAVTKSGELQERMIRFAANVIGWSTKLSVPRPVVDQVTRSSASIGANYAEALNAASKVDFRSKIYIAKKEAAETKYWLQLIARLAPNARNINLETECQSILMILQKAVNTINGQRKSKDQ